MKKLLLFCLLTISLFVNGQDIKGDTKPYDYYCVYYGEAQLSGRIKPLKLIWGELKEEVELYSPEGKKIKFNNMVEVANYMSKRGWEYVDCKVYLGNFAVFFKKTVTNDKQAKEGLYFDTDFEQHNF